MKINEIITEAFDKPYAFNWSRGDHGDYDVFVKLPDGSPLNIAFNREGDDGWHVAFDRGHSQEITGEGDAQRIFATVLTSIQQFILKEEPDRLYFSASKDVEPGQNPTSRARLYERMVRRYANSLGYDVVVDDGRGHTMFILDKDPTVREDRHPNDIPYGPETKPTMPKGTVRVDVSDVYDWYKLGMNISNLDKADKRIFGKGPPSTIMAFGSEDEEHEYIQALQKLGLTTTDIDPVDPNQPRGMKRQKVDPTFNVNESNDGKPLWHINSYDNFETAFEIDLVVDGKDIGFFSYQYDPEQDTVENDVRIINDSERGHGYGKLLLLKAIETAQQHNLPYKRDHRGTSPAQNRVYSSLVDDGIIKIGYDKTITLTGKNLSTTKKKQPKFSLIAHGEYVGHFDDYEDAVREADRIANDPNSKYQMVMVKDNSSKEIVYEVWRGKDLNEEEFNGIDIDMDVEGDEIMVTAMANGRELGHVLFVDEGEYLMPQDLEVDERFQGQGIAAAMYDYVKSKGYKIRRSGQQTDAGAGFWGKHRPEQNVWENFADGKVKGKSRPGRVKRAGASCNGSVTDLRARAKNASGEKAKMYHWCANMKSGRKK
jgi:GNAT superfamily N-acetyltransferase